MNVVQPWVSDLTLMQQTVLLTAIRGPDGSPKYGPTKMVVRWFRRCVLLGSFERAAFTSPYQLGGGSFTGPSISRTELEALLFERVKQARAEFFGGTVDIEGPTHWPAEDWTRLNDASDSDIIEEFERTNDDWTPLMDRLVGDYLRELDALPHHFQLHLLHAAEILGYKHPDARTRGWWHATYLRLVYDMHLWPETEAQLDERLGDSRDGWLARADAATVD